jgi:hypothetical protein
MWLWVILSCFKSVTYNSVVVMNTANAGMSFMEGITPNNKRQLLVAKFQIESDTDDLLVDNISGFIINTLPLPQHYRRHFMEYMDSCLTYIKMPPNKSSSHKFDLEALKKFKHQQEEPIHQCVKMNLAHVVDSPIALKDLFDQQKSFEEQGLLLKKVGMLLGAMFHVGRNYGFVHNDLHFGNILLNRKNGNLVVIDYGRVHFDAHKLPMEVILKAEERIAFEILKCSKRSHEQCELDMPALDSTALDYDDFCLSRAVYPTHEFVLYAYEHGYLMAAGTVFMFDFMTIAMNAVRMMCKKHIGKFEFAKCFKFKTSTKFKTITHVMHSKLIYQLITKTKSVVSKRLMAGAFWFSFFVEYIYSHKLLAFETADGFFKYDNKVTNDFIFTSMQLIDIPDRLGFCKYVEINKTIVSEVMSEVEDTLARNANNTNNTNNAKRGGSMPHTSPHVTKPMHLHHVPKSTFEEVFKAYNNTEKTTNANMGRR